MNEVLFYILLFLMLTVLAETSLNDIKKLDLDNLKHLSYYIKNKWKPKVKNYMPSTRFG